MSSVLPFIFIVLSLAVIIVIIARKFPQLTLLDIDNLQEVKENKKKDELLRKRAEAKTKQVNERMMQRLSPLFGKLKSVQANFRRYVGEVEGKLHTEVKKRTQAKQPTRPKPVLRHKPQVKKELQMLLSDAAQAEAEGLHAEAEQKYITAIKLDAKNVAAYLGLANVYRAQDQLTEAEETYRFVLQLDRSNEAALVALAELSEAEGKLEQAIEYYQQAVLVNDNISSRFARLFDLLMQLEQYETAQEAAKGAVNLEPQNPKYLDSLIESSILGGDQKTAKEAYQELRMVNPENKKLRALKDRIGRMTDKP